MEIGAGVKSLDETSITGELSEDTQFNLRVVSDYQSSPSGIAAEATAVFGSMRYLLNVGIGTGEPAGGRTNLSKVCVQPSGRGIDQFNHVLTIAGQRLLYRAIFQQCGDHWILGRER